MCHCHAKVDFLSLLLFHRETGYFASVATLISMLFPLHCCLHTLCFLSSCCRGTLDASYTCGSGQLPAVTGCRWVLGVNVKHRIAQHEHVCPLNFFTINTASWVVILKTLNPRLKCDSLSITCFRVLLTFTVTPCGRTSAAPVVKANVIAKALTWNKQDHWAISSLSRQAVTK